MTLILGGARSGKSAYAQKIGEEQNKPVIFIATASAGDEEMTARIAEHRAARAPGWHTLEAEKNIGAALRTSRLPEGVVILDCLTLLVSNLLLALPETVTEFEAQAVVDHELDDILAAYREGRSEWVIVSNEVGLGLVPPYPLGRLYRDVLGRANQKIAQSADEVLLMVAGIPMKVK